MSRPPWNNRSHVVDSRDNTKVHEFYRQYFDKPSRCRQRRISLPANPSELYPSLSSTLDNLSHRIPKLKRLGIKNKKTLELGWNQSFQVKISKDNSKFYSTYREYFDLPKAFDHDITVVSTVTGTAHGQKKNIGRKLSDSWIDSSWNRIYSPISENNVVKYKTLRKYFDNSLN